MMIVKGILIIRREILIPWFRDYELSTSRRFTIQLPDALREKQTSTSSTTSLFSVHLVS